MKYIIKSINPFKPGFTIVIFIHYKPRIADSRLVVEEEDLMWFEKGRKLPCIGKAVSWEFLFLKPLVVGKLSLFIGT